MSGALEAGGWYRPEKRPFWPHITLARVKRGERRVPPPPNEPPPPREPFQAAVVTLYRSTLRPQGAIYEPLARTVAGDALDPASRSAAD
jgi:RNA 2',3'-cyclic 3'-phosphodiesterase